MYNPYEKKNLRDVVVSAINNGADRIAEIEAELDDLRVRLLCGDITQAEYSTIVQSRKIEKSKIVALLGPIVG